MESISNRKAIERRRLLTGAAAVAGGTLVVTSPLHRLVLWADRAAAGPSQTPAGVCEGGYGPLAPVADRRDGVARLALPAGFTYRGFSFEGDPWDDIGTVPRAHDGMAAFALPNGNIRLIRNHEDRTAAGTATVKGDRTKAYDSRAGGGTSSLEVAVTSSGDRRLVRHFMSLNGTLVNCAGGPTPWGSWLSCEETTSGSTQGYQRPHGYVFEVPVSAQKTVSAPPLTALGRFVHEAVAIDRRTGILYLTEDRSYTPGSASSPGAGFYRFLPSSRRNLAAGGRLQVLAVKGSRAYDTTRGQTVSKVLPATWVDIDNANPAEAESDSSAVFRQGLVKGAAIFQRLEGAWFGEGKVYFASTSGGDAGMGQIWSYQGGQDDGRLQLVFESPGAHVLDGPDNVHVTPRGGILVCEDGDDEQYLRGLTPNGRIFDFSRNVVISRNGRGRPSAPMGAPCSSTSKATPEPQAGPTRE